jgi:pilus assembly protein Flp/PilA
MMKRIYPRLRQSKVWKDCRGQDLVEYALMAGVVAVAAVAVLPPLGATLQSVFTKIEGMIAAFQ